MDHFTADAWVSGRVARRGGGLLRWQTRRQPHRRFPPPKLLLDSETTQLYIASQGRHRGASAIFVPLEQYITERVRLFIEAIHATD
ncbi:hypothetical protein ACIPWF_16890 [Paenarthrobacter sp. NPDC089989]|uniref:hypothetical protein n=1 Tax=unclassified Paenarthrobacter TaxID=2634190 RepID=UPI003801F2E6